MKKGLKFLLIMFVLMLAFGLSGCINSAAKPFDLEEGITLCPYYDGVNYSAEVFIYTKKIYSESDAVKNADKFIFSVLDSEFETERIEEYPKKGESGDSYYAVFAYYLKINEKDWFFKDENGENEKLNVKNGFFTAKVSADYSNPFALCFVEGTKFNDIYKAFTENETGPVGKISNYLNISDSAIDNIKTTVLLGGNYTLKAETGGVMFDADNNYHYYRFTAPLMDTINTRLKYSYSAVQSYAWWILAIVAGLLAVGLVLLIAKKVNGRVVDAKGKKTVQPTVEFIFDPFDNNGGGTPGGTGNSGGSGGIFDGF